MKSQLTKIYKELDKHGFLMLSDSPLPSLTSIIAGEPVKGSWWGHSQGNLMYNLSNQVMDDPEILTLKFFNKKVTYLRKEHWSALWTISTSQEEWQFKKLSPDSKKLFQKVEKEKTLRADDKGLKQSPTEIGKLASKLEEKLLVYSESIHTDSGKHVRILQSWNTLAKTKKFKPEKIDYSEAIAHFENLKLRLEKSCNTNVKMPW
jgi:hypothetical protein